MHTLHTFAYQSPIYTSTCVCVHLLLSSSIHLFTTKRYVRYARGRKRLMCSHFFGHTPPCIPFWGYATMLACFIPRIVL